jgi:ribonuclease Z
MRSNLRYSKITRIFITHMHGDHIFGLPGLICALSGASAEKRRAGVHKDPEPLYITGPPGICEYVRATMSCSRTVLGLTLVVTELTAPGNGVPGYGADAGRDDQSAVRRQVHFAADHRCKMFLGERWPDNGASTAPVFKDKEGWKRAWAGQLELPFWTVHREKPANVGGSRGGPVGGLVVRAAPLRHPVPCFGYVIDEPDVAGRIDVDKCVALGLQPGKEYARLKNGFDVVAPDGTTITPTQVLGCDRPGRRLCLLGDTCDSIGIAAIAKGADVLIHESTFAAVKHDEAVYKGHSTSVMAGEFAQMISARNLLLTHFSNRYCEGGSDGSETYAGGKQQRDDEVEDDMALPEDAPVDMRAAAKEEFTAVQGLVREAAHAKGDLRVVAASDFFSFNVQRREMFDDSDRAKGNREALFDGPSVAPPLETYEDARARMADGVKGYYSPNYSGNGGAENRGRISGQGGYRGRGRGGGNDGFSGARGRGFGGRGGSSYHNDGGSGNGGYQSTGTVRGDGTRGFKRGEDGSFQRRPSSRNDSGGGESGGDHGNNGAPRRGRPVAVPHPTRGGSEAYQNVSRDRGVSVSPNAFDEN